MFIEFRLGSYILGLLTLYDLLLLYDESLYYCSLHTLMKSSFEHLEDASFRLVYYCCLVHS